MKTQKQPPRKTPITEQANRETNCKISRRDKQCTGIYTTQNYYDTFNTWATILICEFFGKFESETIKIDMKTVVKDHVLMAEYVYMCVSQYGTSTAVYNVLFVVGFPFAISDFAFIFLLCT